MKKLLVITVIAFLSLPFSGAFAQRYSITTVAGNGTGSFSGDGGPATAAELKNDYDAVVDTTTGNIYIADWGNERIRKVNAAGVISTIAGNGFVGYSGDGGQATAAEIDIPVDIITDGAGNVYFTDYNNERVRKISTTGVITTFAGNGTANFSGDGGQATAAEIYAPTGIAIDAVGNIYIAAYYGDRIRKVSTSGIITTIAGNGTAGYSGDGGQATAAEINNPWGIAADAVGNIYITDYTNERVRKINTVGIISTIAGNGTAGFSGDDGPATAAELNGTNGIAIDAVGNVYIADYSNNRVRKINTLGIINTIAGNGSGGYSGDEGRALSAELDNPNGLSVDGSGKVYVADLINNRIRELTPFIASIRPVSKVKCNNDSTGKIVANTTGGIGSYTYSWAPFGGNADSTSGISAGTYTLTVVDSVGDTAIATYILTQPMALTASVDTTTGENCHGDAGAMAHVTATGGTPGYTYSWAPTGGTNAWASGLSAGTYTVAVTDSNGCVSDASTAITQPTALAPIAFSNPALDSCNGMAWATVSGGIAPYTYLWKNGKTTDTISNLCGGTYCYTVTDSHGCKDSTCIVVTGIAQINASAGVNIYPNPFSAKLTVSWAQATQVQSIEIYNMLGKEVYDKMLNQVQHDCSINLSNLADGLYMVRVKNQSGKTVAQDKVMKTN